VTKEQPTLSEQLDAITSSLRTLSEACIQSDNALAEAERRQAEAERQAAKDRRAKQEAEGKVSGLREEIVRVRGAVAGQVETLRAEKEMLAVRDRESREMVERLNMSKGRQIKTRGITEAAA
jgi:chromosome segregation ATPase